ncbi:hypothetical protein Nmel_010153 [Mimus melanotis]
MQSCNTKLCPCCLLSVSRSSGAGAGAQGQSWTHKHTPKMSQGPTLFSCGVMGQPASYLH